MKRRIQALALALCFCTAFLFSSCSFPQKQEEPQVQNHSELTSTESFPIKLNVGEMEYLIASKPRSLAVLSADLVQALGDIVEALPMMCEKTTHPARSAFLPARAAALSWTRICSS